ncbi:SirB1 family protein [Luteimonas terrae]|uniref:Regulator of sirC expression with transglutaminase-like and TPR domain n=1 Tax=Luteimonas terrae TaxID=1530191 RepID=A0ABU1Y2G7_9GAMM|nr:tetratricopeptide repeat protein [Luteimonas terrae]MDR7194660.1 regulator of sirC expression with transglutaminase-like and TPR domain [Luteimonas terrae]
MSAELELPDWASLSGTPDTAMPLFACALLIARDEYPALDVARCDAVLQAHARHLQIEVDAIGPTPLKMQAINRYLFEEAGYAGNHDAYYDPRNSYLNEVIERRLGNPITLAVVQMDVARRLGVALEGISFPGHFLVSLPVGDGMLVMDPFNGGRPLGIEELRSRASPHVDGGPPDDDTLAGLLRPATPRMMLMRMLRNLHGTYAEAEDWARAVRCADRLLSLSRDAPDALRDRGLGYLALGHVTGAREDLRNYVMRYPDAADVDAVREQLVQIGRARDRAH